MGRKKPFADEPGGKWKRSKVAGTVNAEANIEVEGRDYGYRVDQLEERAAEIKSAYKKAFEKRLKAVIAKLAEERHKAVTEGGNKGQQGILFPSLKSAKLQAETATLTHLEIGLGVANRLQNVPLGDLERVRVAIGKALDSASTAKSEDPDAQTDGQSAAAGENGHKQAAG